MKKLIFLATMMSLMSLTVKAQFDDVYYDPARDSRPATTTTRPQTQRPQTQQDNGSQQPYDNQQYDNGSTNGGDYYEYDEDYDDYAYSTRIRRFHQPVRGFDYYSNAYVDYNNYDPHYSSRYFTPSVSIIVGNGYWNRWNSYNRWNSWSWFNRYWDDWRYTSYGFCNPSYYASSFYPSWGYSPYGYGGYGSYYDSYSSPYGYGSSYGYNGYNRYYPYHTGLTTVSNKYNAPRSSGGAIREVTGPNGQISTGRRGDVINPTRNNAPVRPEANVRKEMAGDANGGGISPRNSTGGTPKRYDPVSSDGGRTQTQGTADRPTRTTERPAPNYDRPQRTTETAPNNDRPTRTYDRPAPNYDRPQRTAPVPSSEPTRNSTPRYEAPRQEQRSYSPPPSSSPAPSRSSGGGGGSSSPAPSRSSGGGGSSSSSGHHRG